MDARAYPCRAGSTIHTVGVLFADLFQPLMPFEVFPSEYSIAEFAHLLETATVWEDEGGRVWASPDNTGDEESVDVSLAYVDDTVYPYNGVSAIDVDDWVVFCNPSLWPIVWPHLFD